MRHWCTRSNCTRRSSGPTKPHLQAVSVSCTAELRCCCCPRAATAIAAGRVRARGGRGFEHAARGPAASSVDRLVFSDGDQRRGPHARVPFSTPPLTLRIASSYCELDSRIEKNARQIQHHSGTLPFTGQCCMVARKSALKCDRKTPRKVPRLQTPPPFIT